jgi:DNA-binding protein H-NS
VSYVSFVSYFPAKARSTICTHYQFICQLPPNMKIPKV